MLQVAWLANETVAAITDWTWAQLGYTSRASKFTCQFKIKDVKATSPMKYGGSRKRIAHFSSMTIAKQRARNSRLRLCKRLSLKVLNSCIYAATWDDCRTDDSVRKTKLLRLRAQESVQNKFLTDRSIRVSVVTLEDRFAAITGDQRRTSTISM